jgi:hypothetical protein
MPFPTLHQNSRRLRKTNAGGGGGFSPSSVGGLVVWLEADSGAYKDSGTTLASNGESVVQWNGQGGTGNNALSGAGGTHDPTYVASSINGKPALRFATSSAQWLRLTLAATFSGSAATAFVVAKRASVVSTTSTLSFTDESGNDYDNAGEFIIAYEGSIGDQLQTYRNGPVSTYGSHPGNGVPYLWATKFDGVNNTAYLNGAAQTPVASSGSFSFTKVFIGARCVGGVSNSQYDGDIAAVLLYDSGLSGTDRGNVESYLTTKYGL